MNTMPSNGQACRAEVLSWTEYLADACTALEAGFHFEEGGCFGLARALQQALLADGLQAKLCVNTAFCHAAVAVGGLVIDHQGEVAPTATAGFVTVTDIEFRAASQVAGWSDEEVASDMEWGTRVIETARHFAQVPSDSPFYAERCSG